MEVEAVSCECCGLEEECTGEYIGGVRAYFGGRWLCGLCSEAVKYEAGKCSGAVADVEEAVRAHMAICRTLKSGGTSRARRRRHAPDAAHRVREADLDVLLVVVVLDAVAVAEGTPPLIAGVRRALIAGRSTGRASPLVRRVRVHASSSSRAPRWC
ncbi:hypothetical protein EJB05_04541, partial [Eragrostis curvula]